MHRGTIAALMLLVAALASAATENTWDLAPGATSPPAKIADIAWLQGYWVGTGLGGTVEEAWSPPSAGTMVGMFRMVKDGKPSFYELASIAEQGGTLRMRIKHLDPDLSSWEDKDKSTEFALIELRDGEARFEGLTIRREGKDGLVMFVAIHSKDKPVREAAFCYQRVDINATSGTAR